MKTKTRNNLSASGLFKLVHSGLEKIEDIRADNQKISLADALMSAFAIFSLKDPSLLAFDERRKESDGNLKRLYTIKTIPCDTPMRTIVDEVSPEKIRPLYTDVFRQLQRGKVMEKMVFMENSYLLSLDGTGYFSSNEVHCPSCLEKKNSKTGEIRYAHQLLGGRLCIRIMRKWCLLRLKRSSNRMGRPRMIVSAMPPSVFWRNCVKIIRTGR